MSTLRINRPNSYIEDAWLGLPDLHNSEVHNPFGSLTKAEEDHPGLREISVMKNPDYLSFSAKYILNMDLTPVQSLVLKELWERPFPMLIGSRGFSKTTLLGVYAILRCLFMPETKVVVTGSGFRQAKQVYECMKGFYERCPVFRSMLGHDSEPKMSQDRCIFKINDGICVFIPIGTGHKIRGLRANTILADEFASISPEIYEVVISGFASVSQNPIDSVKISAKRERLKELGQWSKEEEIKFLSRRSNQSIITGTADYDFMHFAHYWKKYFVYVHSKNELDRPVNLPSGEYRTLREYFPDGMDESFDYRDYSIIRIPYELIPRGMLDPKIITRAKASMHKSNYLREYGAVFPTDSDGFFPRSLIESCVVRDSNPIKKHISGSIVFEPSIFGDPNLEYVIGVDPAAEHDNFSIVVLELHPDHRRLVYCWSTNVKEFENSRRKKNTNVYDYYGYCARKIRDLMVTFKTKNIVIDAQGGGRAVLEALHDDKKMKENEKPIWPTTRILKPNEQLETDDYEGLHIAHMFQFANYEHLSDANHGLKYDLEDRVLLFPRFDGITAELSIYQEESDMDIEKSKYDTVSSCAIEIEELKNELSSIVMTKTQTGRDKWDTPQTVLEGKRLATKKDRYSALLMANFIARVMQNLRRPTEVEIIGGFSHQIFDQKKSGGIDNAEKKSGQKRDATKLYSKGPDWFTKEVNSKAGSHNIFRRVKRQ